MTAYGTSNQPELPVLLEKVRQELHACEARFRNIVSRMPDGIVVLDALGMVYFANPAALRFMSQPPDLFFREFNWRLGIGKTLIHETKTSGKATSYEIQVTETEWDLKKAFLVTLHDITTQKKKESDLQQAIDESEARTAELEIMRFVADQLNQAALLEETIQSGLEMIQTLSGSKKVWALLADENNTPHLVLVDRQSQEKNTRRTLLEMPENCTCLKQLLAGELTGFIRIKNCEWAQSLFGESLGTEEHLTFPLIVNNKTTGVLNLAIEPDKVYSEYDINLLESVCRELAAAIERGRALSETSDALHRDERINNFTRTLSSTIDLTTVLQNVIRLSADLIGSDIGLIGLLSNDQSILTFPFNFGLPVDIEITPLARTGSLIWDVISKSEGYFETNLQSSLPELPTAFQNKVSSVLAAPIIGNGRCLGVISLYKTSHKNNFTRFDQTMLESLARQAGMAMINAELYFEVQQLTTIDSLTGVNNRLSFENLAIKEVERSWRYGRPLSLIVVDIDRLNDYNQAYGYEAGNDALRALAHACSFGLRRVDILGRLQNDEMVLLLPETDLKNATDVAERLRLQIATIPLSTPEGSSAITASMGLTGVEGRQEIDLQTLLDRAEMALFEAKKNGRNRVVAWKLE
jgi:diguanylate cyclase (GGDEF)-like protein